ncbi:TolC family protein [Flavitalea flava]
MNRKKNKMARVKAITLLALAGILIFSDKTFSQDAMNTPQVQQQTPQKILSLQDCLDIGFARSTEVLKGRNNVELAGALVLNAYGQFLPDLNAGAGYNYSTGKNFVSVSGPTVVNANRSAFNYQLTSTLNLFTGHYNYASLKAATLNKKSSELTLQRAEQQISLDITQTFLQVMLDKKVVSLEQENWKTSMDREKQLTALTEVGRKALADLYQQQAQTSRDQSSLINAQNRLRTDKILLLKKLRLDSLDRFEFGEVPVDEQPQAELYGDGQSLVRKALSQRVDLQSYKLDKEVADWNIQKFRSGYLPRVFLGAGVFSNGAYFDKLYVNGVNTKPGSQSGIGDQLTSQINGSVSVNASWALFDRYYTRSNTAIAKIVSRNAQIDLENQHIQIVSEMQQAYGDYTTSLQQITTAEKGVIAAEKAFETLNGRYREGAANFIELSTAQINLLEARQNKIQSIISLMLQKKVIDFYLGN